MRNFIIICLLLMGFQPCFGKLDTKSYHFDCGPEGSGMTEGATPFTPDMGYKPERGYGWIQFPEEGFVNHQFRRSRDAFKIDGVLAESLAIKLDLPGGKWWLTLYADTGYQETTTPDLKVNGQVVEMNWQSFKPPSEPSRVLKTSYRVYQGLFDTTDGLHIEFLDGTEKVRLLGFTVIPNTLPANDLQRQLVGEIRQLGEYPGGDSLLPVHKRLQELRAAHPKDSFYDFWEQQTGLLLQAEDHFMKRGWEKYRKPTGLGIWGHLYQGIMLLDGLLNHPDASASPLYERALFLRGRLLYWLGLQRHGPDEIAGGERDLAALYRMYPDDPLLAMYNGEKVDTPDPCDDLVDDPNAPGWSNRQRELLCRLRNMINWWVTEQQAENGEFGGKLGDDVELLRWWTPVLLSGDSTALVGWTRLADEIFRNRKVHKGYSKRPIDVEHGSEFIADTAPIMAVCRDEPKYLKRLKYSADYFVNLWTGKSDNGRRFFRSSWFSSTEVDDRPPRNRDCPYNARATKAVRYYAWKAQDASVLEALNEWSEAWLSAAMRTDKGKPVGIMPATVRFPDEVFNGDGENWYRANMFWPYFEWERSPGSKMLDQLMFSYTVTRDEKFLQPLLIALDLIREHAGQKNPAEIGTAAWAAEHLKENSSFWSVAAQWRLLTGDERYDDLLMEYGTPYLKYRLTGAEHFLEEGLEKPLEYARYNTPLKTYEALHTDRVYIRGHEHLTTMLTGNVSNEALSPNFAVTWRNTDENFTALVKESRFDRLTIDLYSHSDGEEEIDMRIWQLEPGGYEIVYRHGDRTDTKAFELKAKGQRLAVQLPGRQLVTIDIKTSGN